MAIFYMQVLPLSRAAGRRATASAAYRAGERIRDERSGELLNYSRREDVLHKEIILPAKLGAAGAAWARDRSALWNAAERAESRRNATVAREFQVALPVELGAPQRQALAQEFSHFIADRYQVAVDLAVHAPRPGGDPRNYHAHLLTTTREVTAAGLGAKTGLDRFSAEDRRTSIAGRRSEYLELRERWAHLANSALRAANLDVRIDHRSLAQQGLEREPGPRFSMAAVQMERRGTRSAAAERLREEYRARVTERAAQRSRGAEQAKSADLEEVRRQARESWLRMRPREVGKSLGRGRADERDAQREARPESQRERDEDLAR